MRFFNAPFFLSFFSFLPPLELLDFLLDLEEDLLFALDVFDFLLLPLDFVLFLPELSDFDFFSFFLGLAPKIILSP